MLSNNCRCRWVGRWFAARRGVVLVSTLAAAVAPMAITASSRAAVAETEYRATFNAKCVAGAGFLNETGTVEFTTSAMAPTEVRSGEEISLRSARASATFPDGFTHDLLHQGAVKVRGLATSLEVTPIGAEPTVLNLAEPSEYPGGLPFEAGFATEKPITFAIPSGPTALSSTFSYAPIKITAAPGGTVTMELSHLPGVNAEDEVTGRGIQAQVTGYNSSEKVAGLTQNVLIGCTAPRGVILGTVPVQPPAPTVTKVEPGEGPGVGGTTVSITGTNLGRATAVSFGSHPATSFEVISNTKITAVAPRFTGAPSGAGFVDVTITTPSGTSPTGAADIFSYYAQPSSAPVLLRDSNQLPILETCKSGAEVSECPVSERQHIASGTIPLLGFGAMTLHTPYLAGGVTCLSTLNATGWNEHEGGVESAPIRAYALIEGWTASACTSPEILSAYENSTGESNLTLFAAAEPPLEAETTEAAVCSAAGEAAGHTTADECLQAGETQTTELAVNIRRRSQTLPWKAEFLRGETTDHERVSRMRIGVATLGECGPGEAEATTEDPSVCSGRAENTKCYPASRNYTEVPAGCLAVNIVIPQIPLEIPAFGTLEPTWRGGIKSGLFPSSIAFEEPASGSLVSPGHGTNKGSVFGSMKIIGNPGLQLIGIK